MSEAWNVVTGDPTRDRRNVAILLDAVAELYRPQPLPDLLAHALERALLLAGAERAFLFLAEGDTLDLAVARDHEGRTLPPDAAWSRSVVEKVQSSGHSTFLLADSSSSPISLTHSISALQLRSVLAVPLRTPEGILGVLYVDSRVRAQSFAATDAAVLEALGSLVGTAVQTARLIDARTEAQQVRRELAVAHEIQKGLLPAVLPALPGLDLAAIARPCEATSGDYYDALLLADGSLLLAIGDVSGHGLGPALIMASTRALLRAFLEATSDPVPVMRHVNSFLVADSPPSSYVSLFLGRVFPENQRLSWVSAGHNPPLLIRREGGKVLELKRTGPVLGILEDAAYTEGAALSLHAGDVLTLYTDGVFEAQRPDGQMYGEDRLRATLSEAARAGVGAAEIRDRLLLDLDTFLEGRRPADDLTLLVVRSTEKGGSS